MSSLAREFIEMMREELKERWNVGVGAEKDAGEALRVLFT